MKNVKLKVFPSGRVGIIFDPNKDFGPSRSGASIIVASTDGFVDIGKELEMEELEGYGLNLNLSRRIKKEKAEKPASKKPAKTEAKPRAASGKTTVAKKAPAKTSTTKKATVEKTSAASKNAKAGRRSRA